MKLLTNAWEWICSSQLRKDMRATNLWLPMTRDNYNDTSYNTEAESHVIYFTCIKTGKSKREIFYACGLLTDAQLKFKISSVVRHHRKYLKLYYPEMMKLI